MGMHTVLVCDVEGLEKLIASSKRSHQSNISIFADGYSHQNRIDSTNRLLASMPAEIDKIRGFSRGNR